MSNELLISILNKETPEELEEYLSNDVTKAIFSFALGDDQFVSILKMNGLIMDKDIDLDVELNKILTDIQEKNLERNDDDESIII